MAKDRVRRLSESAGRNVVNVAQTSKRGRLAAVGKRATRAPTGSTGVMAVVCGRGRYAPEAAEMGLGASFYDLRGDNGPLDRQQSALGALLGVGPVRFADLGSSNPSLNHLDISLRKEHY